MQRTLREPVRFTGCGLHTGKTVTLRVEPAPVGHGLRFVRTDLPQGPEGLVSPAAAVESTRCMQLRWGGDPVWEVLTPEHLLSACAGLGVRNARLVLDGPEVPILDGSAAPFAVALVESGLQDQPGPDDTLHLSAPLVVCDGAATVLCRPAPRFSLTCVVSYPHPLVGTQIYDYDGHTDYLSQVAPARTFAFMEEIEALRQQGLIAGGSLDCAVVVMADQMSSPLRFPDEMVRHKMLDLIGDLAVLGRPLAAHVLAVRGSHRLHARLLKALQAAPELSPEVDMTVTETLLGFDVGEIQKVLPHRFPFLLVDRMLSIENGLRGRGIKNVTINEPYFQGHYPGKPIMPGVMIVEALAQVGAIVLMNGQRHKRLTPYLAGIDTLRFRRPVVPGDQLLLEVELTVVRGDIGKMKVKATVDGQVAVQGEMSFALKEEKDS